MINSESENKEFGFNKPIETILRFWEFEKAYFQIEIKVS